MDQNQLKKFCQALDIKLPRNIKNKGWNLISCPFAEIRHDSGRDTNPSFGIKTLSNGTSICKCFSCKFGGDLYDLAFEIYTLYKDDPDLDFKTAFKLCEDEENGISELALAGFEDEEETRQDVHYFGEDWLDSFPKCTQVKQGYAYNISRGIPRWVQDALDLRFDTNEQRVCFPIRDFSGYLVGFHGRQIHDEQPVYRMYQYRGRNNPQFWLGEDWVDLDEPLVCVESVYDLAKVYQVYQNVICPLTAEITAPKIKRLEDALYLINMFDGDTAGQTAAKRMQKHLNHVPQKTIYLPEGVDPGKMTVSQIRKYLAGYIKNSLLS